MERMDLGERSGRREAAGAVGGRRRVRGDVGRRAAGRRRRAAHGPVAQAAALPGAQRRPQGAHPGLPRQRAAAEQGRHRTDRAGHRRPEHGQKVPLYSNSSLVQGRERFHDIRMVFRRFAGIAGWWTARSKSSRRCTPRRTGRRCRPSALAASRRPRTSKTRSGSSQKKLSFLKKNKFLKMFTVCL